MDTQSMHIVCAVINLGLHPESADNNNYIMWPFGPRTITWMRKVSFGFHYISITTLVSIVSGLLLNRFYGFA